MMQDITLDTAWIDYNFLRVDRPECYMFSFKGNKRDLWIARGDVLKIDKRKERFQVYTWRAKERGLI